MPFSKNCIIAEPIKKPKKTSRYRLVNWIYRKLFGYTYESPLPEGCSVILIGDNLVFRDQETYDRITKFII